MINQFATNAPDGALGRAIHGVSGWRLPTMQDTGPSGCDTAFVGANNGQQRWSDKTNAFFTCPCRWVMSVQASNRRNPYRFRPGSAWGLDTSNAIARELPASSVLLVPSQGSYDPFLIEQKR